MAASCILDDVQGNPEQPRNQRQAECDVGLALGRAFPRSLERKVVIYHRVRRLRRRPKASRTPDPLVIAFAVQPREDLCGTRYLAHDSKPCEQLEPIHGKGYVRDSTLVVRVQRVA